MGSHFCDFGRLFEGSDFKWTFYQTKGWHKIPTESPPTSAEQSITGLTCFQRSCGEALPGYTETSQALTPAPTTQAPTPAPTPQAPTPAPTTQALTPTPTTQDRVTYTNQYASGWSDPWRVFVGDLEDINKRWFFYPRRRQQMGSAGEAIIGFIVLNPTTTRCVKRAANGLDDVENITRVATDNPALGGMTVRTK